MGEIAEWAIEQEMADEADHAAGTCDAFCPICAREAEKPKKRRGKKTKRSGLASKGGGE